MAVVGQRGNAQTRAGLARGDSARLSGIVRDSAGAPVRHAEVILADANVTIHTGDDGRFVVAARPGTYDGWFRKVGYQTVR
jgi:hypothetical protein